MITTKTVDIKVIIDDVEIDYIRNPLRLNNIQLSNNDGIIKSQFGNLEINFDYFKSLFEIKREYKVKIFTNGNEDFNGFAQVVEVRFSKVVLKLEVLLDDLEVLGYFNCNDCEQEEYIIPLVFGKVRYKHLPLLHKGNREYLLPLNCAVISAFSGSEAINSTQKGNRLYLWNEPLRDITMDIIGFINPLDTPTDLNFSAQVTGKDLIITGEDIQDNLIYYILFKKSNSNLWKKIGVLDSDNTILTFNNIMQGYYNDKLELEKSYGVKVVSLNRLLLTNNNYLDIDFKEVIAINATPIEQINTKMGEIEENIKKLDKDLRDALKKLDDRVSSNYTDLIGQMEAKDSKIEDDYKKKHQELNDYLTGEIGKNTEQMGKNYQLLVKRFEKIELDFSNFKSNVPNEYATKIVLSQFRDAITNHKHQYLKQENYDLTKNSNSVVSSVDFGGESYNTTSVISSVSLSNPSFTANYTQSTAYDQEFYDLVI